jgi:hypothetical protein
MVLVGGRELGSGEGRSKKAAEQQAAETAWRALSDEAEGGAAGGVPAQPPPADPKASQSPAAS